MSNSSTNLLQDAINRLENATIRRTSNSFLLNIFLLGLLFLVVRLTYFDPFALGIYTSIYFKTLYIYCRFIGGPHIILLNVL